MVFVNVKVKRVVGVFGVVRVARLGLCPGDDLAHIFHDGFALANVLQREYALAVHAGAAGLNTAGIATGHGLACWVGLHVCSLFCSSDNGAQKFGMVNRMGVRRCALTYACARTCAHARTGL